jgi:hypothetical protein
MVRDRATTAEMERVLTAALTALGDVPWIRIVDEGDLIRCIAPGRPYQFLNGIVRLDLDPMSVEARVEAVSAEYRALGLPGTWWVTPASRPSDLPQRLTALGFERGEDDAAMVIELDPWPETLERAAVAVPDGFAIREVGSDRELEEFVSVMAEGYGWADARKARTLVDLYHPIEAPRHGRRQFVGRLGDRPVTAASLFEVAGYAWVTNVATIPDARGQGAGAAVTVATLRLAAELGHRRAYLAGSLMGTPVYRRLGFLEVGRLVTYLAPGG